MSEEFDQLKEHKSDLLALFASKGWEIWLEWAKREVSKEYTEAIHGETAQLREEARVNGKALERFVRVPFFLAEQIGIAQAKGAVPDFQEPTPEAE